MCPCVGVHIRTSRMSWSLLLPVVPVRLASIKLFLRWEVSGRTSVLFRIYSKQYTTSLCSSQLAIRSVLFRVQEVQLYCNTARLKLGRITVLFYQRSGFHMAVKLSVAVPTLPTHMLTSVAISYLLKMKCINWYPNFSGLSFTEDLTQNWLKHMNYVLSAFT